MLHRNHAARSGLAALAALGLALLAGACQPESTIISSAELSAADTAGFTPMALSQAQSEMAQSGIRVEVHVRPGSDPLVATLLALGPASMSSEPEQVQANITGIDETENTITLDLGGLVISYDDNTGFSPAENTAAVAELSREGFVAAVRTGLAAGRRPHVMVRRAPPASPQGPDDATFLADHIRLGGSADVWMIGLNAGPANLLLNANPPPDAFLKLLGLSIEIRISDGTTRIGRKHDVPGQRVEFRDRVKAVFVDRGAFMLASGVAIRVNDNTVIEDHHDMKSLADVAAALEAGWMVTAEGVGTVESRDPKVLLALKVRFSKQRPHFEFRDFVKSVNLDRRAITLRNGATLCFTSASVIDESGDLTSLEQVARALNANLHVIARGVATHGPTTTANDCRAVVLKVRFELAPPPVLEFRDLVKSVDLESKKVTLASGAVICFDNQSVIWQDGELDSLEDVARALEAGLRVAAAGSATPGPYDAGCRVTVLRVKFTLVPAPVVFEFADAVKAVDVAARSITLGSGAVLCLNEHSVINQDSELRTLADVAAALEAGKAVKAAGVATPNPAAGVSNVLPCRGMILKVTFGVRA